jgi:threonine/homoserine/homoserine lactone efflux protein
MNLAFGYALQAITLGLSAAAMPGPFQAYLISQALRLGWKRALPAVLAPLFSDTPILILVLFVLTNLPPTFLRVLQLGGALFILFLAWKSWLAFRAFNAEALPAAGEARQNLPQAVLMNLLNPNPYLFWSIVTGPILISAWKIHPVNGLTFLISFYVAMISGLALLVVLFGAARNLGPRVNRGLIGVSALALFAFGLYQLWQGVAAGVSLM